MTGAAWGALALGASIALGRSVVDLAFGSRPASAADRLLRWASGVAVGVGALSSLFSALLLGGARREAAARVAVLVITAAAAIAAWARRRLPPDTAVAPRGGARRAVVGLAAVALAVAAAAAVEHGVANPAGDWDATMIWNLRARMLFRGPVADAFPPEAFPSQPGYPLMLPALVVLGWTVLGVESTLVPALIGPVAGIVCVVLVAAAAARLRGWDVGLLAAAFLASTPLLAGTVTIQAADLPLAALVLVAVVACTLGAAARSTTLLALAGAAAGMAAWTKNEGLLFAASLVVGLLLQRGTPLASRARAAAALAAGARPLLAVLAWFKLSTAPASELLEDPIAAKLRRLVDLPRLGLLGVTVARRLLYFQKWGGHVAAAILALALTLRWGPRSPAVRPAAIAIGLTLAGFLLTYATTPYDLEWHVAFSADRLMFQCWPAAVFLLAVAIPLREEAGEPSPAREVAQEPELRSR